MGPPVKLKLTSLDGSRMCYVPHLLFDHLEIWMSRLIRRDLDNTEKTANA
jgi:hypothetical protein